jgi:tetracycline 7-halogenase / FADH2 O2-dependent halogenase
VIDPDGRVTLSVALPGWTGVELAAVVSEEAGCPVSAENYCRASALAEQWRGLGCGVDDMVYIHVGQRTGTGIIVGGRPLRGHSGAAGEIGALPVDGWAEAPMHLLSFPGLEPDARTVFTHMRGVRPYDCVENSSGQPSRWHEGTLHHLFDGGWLWVIPFDNHSASDSDLVSVGLNIDARSAYAVDGLTAEQEWSRFLERFPSIAAQFAAAEPAFPWVSTGRTQFSSSRTVGDRWAMMSHAAGAIDALFSRGMANTMAVIEEFVPTFLAARREDDFSADRFRHIDRLNQGILDNNDKLVAGSYIAFRDFDLWRAWSKMWYLAWNLGVIRIAGSYYRYLETGDARVLDAMHEGPAPGSFCPDLTSVQEQFDACFAVMEKVDRGGLDAQGAIPRLAILLSGGEASPQPLNLHDVLRRWHDGSAETQRLIYEWGRTASPVALRHYFDYDRSTIEVAARTVLTS